MVATKKSQQAAKARQRSISRSTSPSDTPTRGRSPGSSVTRLAERGSPESSESAAASSLAAASTSSPSTPSVIQARPAKRKRRSELSPSSKASHSTIERERREAMNERFNELAGLIPQLQEAIAQGRKPTKGEIVKASIVYHLQQEERLQHLSRQLELLANHSTAANILTSAAAHSHAAAAAAAARGASSNSSSASVGTSAFREASPAPSSADSHTTRFGELIDQANLHDHSSDAGSTPHTEVGFNEASSPFKDTAMAPGWNAAPPSGWPSHDDPGYFGSDVGPRDLLNSFDLAGLSHGQFLPPSSWSSPPQSLQFDHNGAARLGLGPESLMAQRSLLDSFEADPFALLSSHLEIQDAAQLYEASCDRDKGGNEVDRAYTLYQVDETTLTPPTGKHTLELDGDESLELLRSTAPAVDFAFIPDGDFFEQGFEFSSERSDGLPFLLADQPGEDSSQMAAAVCPEDVARAFPTLLRTDKPTLAPNRP